MKTKTILVLLLALLAGNTFAQNEFQQKFGAAYEISQRGNHKQALQDFQALLPYAPDYAITHAMISWSYLMLGNNAEAIRHADYALLFDPLGAASYATAAYVAYTIGNDVKGAQFLNIAIWMAANDEESQNFIKDMSDLAAAGVNPAKFNALKASVPALFQKRNKAFPPVMFGLIKGNEQITANNPAAAVAAFKEMIAACNFPAEYQYFKGLFTYQAGSLLQQNQNWKEAKPFYEQALGEFVKYPNVSAYVQTILASRLGSIYWADYNTEKAFSILSEYVSLAASLPAYAGLEKGNFFSNLCKADLELQKYAELKKHALLYFDFGDSGDKIRNRKYETEACNYYGVASIQGKALPSDIEKGKGYLEKALTLATEAGDKDMQVAVKSNLAYCYYLQNNFELAKKTYQECAEYDLSKKAYMSAQKQYNNLGALCYAKKDYTSAVLYLRKAVDIVESYRGNYAGEQKLNFLALNISSYRFLAMSLAAQGDASQLFEIQNAQRARMLAEVLRTENSATNPLTLKEFQQGLKPDEAALIYSLSVPGKVVINVVTASTATALEHSSIEGFVALKKKYLDRINKATEKRADYKPVQQVISDNGGFVIQKSLYDQFDGNDFNHLIDLTRELLQNTGEAYDSYRAEFLRHYYDFLIKPVSTQLGSAKKLIIFPEGVLNFLPYESLINPSGKYLIENFDVRYAPSPEAKRLIENRKYGQRPNELLAMGGANYSQMNEQSDDVRGPGRLVQLQSKANLNALNGKPQREIYAALGFGAMHYLPGTLEEVKAISKYFPTKADIYIGDQMTENFLKSLSKSNKLKEYKIIHLATHGFAIPEIPELSGVAMCIYPDMQGGEDGYLTAPEISKLGMQADLAVLSACETGLGKIYNGEGVAGLTQALLTGGANAALVSLWPVSDEGTMYFMTGMYELTQTQGKNYNDAVNIMKRKFIDGSFGESFREPNIWAPFVLYGR